MQKFNVIAMAVLLTLVVVKGADLLADELVNPQMLAKNVYVVEGVVQKSTSDAPKGPRFDPVEPLLAEASAQDGMKIAKQCVQCHVLQKGAGRGGKIGPNLYNVVNRDIASQEGMDYSNALKKLQGEKWTYANLNHYLWKPRDYARGTKMSYAGLKKVEDRAAIIKYLHSLSDAPAALPGA